jgi:hypothetical protein
MDMETITSSPTHEMAMIENTNFSKRVRRMLGLSLDIWENAMLISLGITALAAVLTGISTYAVSRLQKVEAEAARAELDKYKLEAGRQIADANARGEEAKAIAAKANLELERFKAPRSLEAEPRSRIIEKMKAFRGTTFEIVTFPMEPEPTAFAQTISDILVQSGWSPNPNNSEDSLLSPFSGMAVRIRKQPEPKHEKAGKALVESLTAEGIIAKLEAVEMAAKPIAIAIEIYIGTKH